MGNTLDVFSLRKFSGSWWCTAVASEATFITWCPDVFRTIQSYFLVTLKVETANIETLSLQVLHSATNFVGVYNATTFNFFKLYPRCSIAAGKAAWPKRGHCNLAHVTVNNRSIIYLFCFILSRYGKSLSLFVLISANDHQIVLNILNQ